MDNKTRPPIPPNCPYFVLRGDPGQWCFEAFFPYNGVRRWLNFDIDHNERKIIAAVARCAWLDEARGWASVLPKTNFNHDAILESVSLCKDNAEAWRIWGLQK